MVVLTIIVLRFAFAGTPNDARQFQLVVSHDIVHHKLGNELLHALDHQKSVAEAIRQHLDDPGVHIATSKK